jgi:hypothetical protein
MLDEKKAGNFRLRGRSIIEAEVADGFDGAPGATVGQVLRCDN